MNRAEHILSIARVIDNFHLAVIENDNMGNKVSLSKIASDQNVALTTVNPYVDILVEKGVLTRNKKTMPHTFRWRELTKNQFNALAFVENNYKKLHPKAKNIVHKHEKSKTLEVVSKPVMTDAELVAELRKRGWEVSCTRKKEVVTVVEETL